MARTSSSFKDRKCPWISSPLSFLPTIHQGVFFRAKLSPSFIPLLVYLHPPPTYSLTSSQADYWVQSLVAYYPEELKEGTLVFTPPYFQRANRTLQVSWMLFLWTQIVSSLSSRTSFQNYPSRELFPISRYVHILFTRPHSLTATPTGQ